MVIQDVPRSEKLFIGGDFNGHVGEGSYEYDTTHGGFCYGRKTMEEFLSWTLRLSMNCGSKLIF